MAEEKQAVVAQGAKPQQAAKTTAKPAVEKMPASGKKPVAPKQGKPSAPKQAKQSAPLPEEITSSRIIFHPVTTEKAVGGIESRNEICVIVLLSANKGQIRKEAEALFRAKVADVRTSVSQGKKKAFIKFVKQGDAADVASRLKMI